MRNAFAHSLYHFSLTGHNIVLENYGGKFSKIKQLTFDEWTEIFLISSLLQNSYHNKFSSEIEDRKEFKVKIEHGGGKDNGVIYYDRKSKKFTGRINS